MNKFKTKNPIVCSVQYIALSIFLLCSCENLFSQDVQLSQYWSAPLDINPALAGISYGPRVSLNYRNQWPQLGSGFDGGYNTYMAGFDMYIPKARSGVGLLYTGDYIANGILASNKLTLSYALQIKLTKKVGMRIGLEGTFIQRSLKWSQLQFYDQINPYTGFFSNIDEPNPTSETPPQQLSTYKGDAGAGILFFSEKFYGGFSIRNLIMPKESYYNNSAASTPFRMVGHLGANFNIKHKRNYRYNIFVSPNVLVANQGRNLQVNAGIMAGVSVVYFGAWFRYAFQNADAAILLVGFKKGKFRLGYSYDISVSKLMGKTGGSHELSLVFNWSGNDDNSLNPRANKAYIPCPEILNF